MREVRDNRQSLNALQNVKQLNTAPESARRGIGNITNKHAAGTPQPDLLLALLRPRVPVEILCPIPARSQALSADLSKPFQDVYKLLIDAYLLRLEDDYKFSGNVDADSIYGGAPNGYGGFRRFLLKVEKKDVMLPQWWSREKQTALKDWDRLRAGVI
ncbi:hypothetical protein LTS15_002148 [Exophiala xenobiotica]|nr:hypothetical protein LTS15_002148 [Exophiala xenobiotica]